MGKSKYICPCFKVTYDDIRKAVNDGADSFKKVKKATKVSGKCGHCECRVKTFTKEMLKDMEKRTCGDNPQGNKKSNAEEKADKSKDIKKLDDEKKAAKKLADRDNDDKRAKVENKASGKIADKGKETKSTEGEKKVGQKLADSAKEAKSAKGKKKADKKLADRNEEAKSTKGKKKEGKKLADRNKEAKSTKGKKKAGKEKSKGKNLMVQNHNSLKMRVIKLDDKNYKLKDIR